MESPQPDYSPQGTLRSRRFDDVYFSRDDGLAESQYVFLEHNRLAERFARLDEYAVFTIAETGFGTGLNCLLAWQLFNATAPATARLVFISAERYPLEAGAIGEALSHWPQLRPELDALLDVYPPLFPGFHWVELAPNVTLHLLLGDATDTLGDLNADVNAWFLDGFAPSKNPELWQPSLFEAMERLSAPGATVATFTAARLVRDGLAGTGFDVQRVPGYGRKRTMVQATFQGRCGPPRPGLWPANEWAWPDPADDREALVVGAGLAGAHTARALAERGWAVTVLEQHAAVADGASGNAQGAVYARLSHQDSVSNRFYSQALEFAQQRLARLPDTVPHDACGLLQLNQGGKEAKRFQAWRSTPPYPETWIEYLDPAAARTVAGVPLDAEALYFPEGGWVNPRAWGQQLLHHPRIDVRLEHRVTEVSRHDDRWRLTADTPAGVTTVDSPVVIFTTAWQSGHLTSTDYLPVRPIAGQVTRVPSQGALNNLSTVICTDRYLVPAWDGQHCLGATFHLKTASARHSDEDDADNLTALSRRLPGVIKGSESVSDARAGVRCASPDYMPMVGPLLDPTRFTELYRTPLRKRRTQRLPEPPWQHGLWVNIAHGSKGLCSTPLAAQCLAARLNGEPLPVPQRVANHLNPNRFLIRELIRGPA